MMNNERVYYSHDAEMQAMRRTSILTFLCISGGLAVGAALALLFAPSSGEKTRKNLTQNIGDGVSSGRESFEPVIKKLEDQFNDLRKNVEDRLKQN
ncbi:MAG: YtxH domain-containing protein [Phototrophicales bacterium]|nr:YtxH domain-containing protein [Phototrophicales bacterium]